MPFFKFNPSFLSIEDLTRNFVVNKVALDVLLKRIASHHSATDPHILVLGGHGMGKTMLVLQVAESIRIDSKLDQHWYPLVFREEVYEILTATEFWLETMYVLARQTHDEDLMRHYMSLKADYHVRPIDDKAIGCIRDFALHENKRILLIVENIHLLLKQVTERERHLLRDALQALPKITLLGTATTWFDLDSRADNAMNNLFWPYTLEPLDPVQCQILWALVSNFELKGDKIRPIHILTGGNPRLVAMFASLAGPGPYPNLLQGLTELIDEHTDYFKCIQEALPVAERKVFSALANLWQPAAAREVAEATCIEPASASALLRRLVARGVVSDVGEGRRKSKFQLTNRIWNIYCLMRRHSPQMERLRALLDFMVQFYNQEPLARQPSLTQQALDALLSQQASLHQPLTVHLDLANHLGSLGRYREAWKHASTLLDDPSFVHEYTAEIVDFVVMAAASGQLSEALEHIKSCRTARLLEPLVIALQILVSEDVTAPVEAVEVANDVIKRVQARNGLT